MATDPRVFDSHLYEWERIVYPSGWTTEGWTKHSPDCTHQEGIDIYALAADAVDKAIGRGRHGRD